LFFKVLTSSFLTYHVEIIIILFQLAFATEYITPKYIGLKWSLIGSFLVSDCVSLWAHSIGHSLLGVHWGSLVSLATDGLAWPLYIIVIFQKQ
jgi:ABC-type Mn2+/Zn2+ transport system permease subunit